MDKLKDWLVKILSNPYKYVWEAIHVLLLAICAIGVLAWSFWYYLLPR